MIPNRDRLMSRLEAAQHLGVVPATLDRWCRVGLRGVRLAQARIGGRIFFAPEDLEEFQKEVDRRRQPGVPLHVEKRRVQDSVDRCWRLLVGRPRNRNGAPAS